MLSRRGTSRHDRRVRGFCRDSLFAAETASASEAGKLDALMTAFIQEICGRIPKAPRCLASTPARNADLHGNCGTVFRRNRRGTRTQSRSVESPEKDRPRSAEAAWSGSITTRFSIRANPGRRWRSSISAGPPLDRHPNVVSQLTGAYSRCPIFWIPSTGLRTRRTRGRYTCAPRRFRHADRREHGAHCSTMRLSASCRRTFCSTPRYRR